MHGDRQIGSTQDGVVVREQPGNHGIPSVLCLDVLTCLGAEQAWVVFEQLADGLRHRLGIQRTAQTTCMGRHEFR